MSHIISDGVLQISIDLQAVGPCHEIVEVEELLVVHNAVGHLQKGRQIARRRLIPSTCLRRSFGQLLLWGIHISHPNPEAYDNHNEHYLDNLHLFMSPFGAFARIYGCTFKA